MSSYRYSADDYPDNATGWIIIFSPETWEIAKKTDYRYAAFPLQRTRQVRRIREGDFLYPYITRKHLFAGILRVSGSYIVDNSSEIFASPGIYPVILPVHPQVILEDESCIEASSLFGRLTIFFGSRAMKSPYGVLRNSPLQLRSSDSKELFLLLSQCLTKL